MTTISKQIPRGDILLHRGSDERIGVLWEQSRYADGYEPVDLSGWEGTFTLQCQGQDVYFSQCTTTSDGYCWADIAADDLGSTEWQQRLTGEWRLTATDGTQTELLAWGFYEIV